MSKQISFKDMLDKLFKQKIDKDSLPKTIGQLATEKSITLIEAVLLAQINKAICGDTSSAVFLRDTSGNKLKDRVNEERLESKSFEDL